MAESGTRRVLHYTRLHSVDHWGGREQVVDQYCRGLRRQGFESVIYATNVFREPENDTVHGTEVRRFPYYYPFFPLSEERRARMDRKGGNPFSPELLRALDDDPADLFHLHTGSRLGAQILARAQRRGRPVVYSLHGGQFVVPESEQQDITRGARGLLDWGKVAGWWYRSRELPRRVDRLLCVGNNEYLAATERGIDHAVYLPNGVDEERFAGGDGDRFRRAHGLQNHKLLLCCGRIDTQKNQLGLVTDLAPLLRERADTHLLLVGSSTNAEYRGQVEARARETDVADRVHLLGNLDPSGNDLIDVYAACDVFVLPSVAEPFGIVILEAWAASRPVAASRVDGVPYFVEHDCNGLLFDPGTPGVIREAVARLLDHPDLAGRLAGAGRATVEREFTWTRITERLARIYREL